MMASSRLKAQENSLPLKNLLPTVQLPAAVGEIMVSGLSADSRKVKAGDLFVALPGLNTNGVDYIADAINAGAVAAVSDASGAAELEVDTATAEVPVISMTHLREQLSSIAAAYYGLPAQDLNIYAVTGTNGKTTVCYLLGQLLAGFSKKTGVIGTLGYGVIEVRDPSVQIPFTSGLVETGFTTPDAIELQEIFNILRSCDVSAAVMEVSSHSLSQSRLSAVPVNVAIFTNLTQDHLDYHGTMDAYGEAKAKLFAMSSVKHVIINIDDEFGRRLASEAVGRGQQCLTYSLENEQADIFASSINVAAHSTQVVIKTPWGDGMFHTALIGRFNVSNLLAIIGAACVGTNVSLADVLAGVANLAPVPGRMQSLLVADRLVVVDYAHTPDALQHALQTLRPYVSGTLRCVFGCGGDRDKAKRPKMGAIAGQLADVIYVTSDNPRSEPAGTIISDILSGVTGSEHVNVLEDRAQAIRTAIQEAVVGDAVLIAGKGHENYQIIGTEKHHFSDVEVAQQALIEIGGTYD